MAPTIRMDNDVWERLKKESRFVDSSWRIETPSEVLRRLLSLPKPTPSPPRIPPTNGTRNVLQADRDYANVPITGYEFEGGQWQVRTYKDVLLHLCETLRRQHGERFDGVALTLHGKKRNYFSRSDSAMKHPRKVSGGGPNNRDLYVESNLSATSIMGLCQHLIRSLGHDVARFRVH